MTRTVPLELNIRLTPAAAYEAWKSLHWAIPDPLSAADVDADGDLRPNLLEFAQGTNPRSPDSPGTGLSITRNGSGRLVMELMVNSARVVDLVFTAEFQNELPFTASSIRTASPTINAPTAGSGSVMLQVVDPHPSAPETTYGRWRLRIP
jgi:hypothetical protein